MKKDIQAHINSCLQCKVRKKSNAKPTPLQPLPTVDQPNQQVHINLFGPLKTSEQGNKMVLVMTDAFSKYAEAIAIPDKQADTVAMEIFTHWICIFGSPIQIHSDKGTEFVNKLNKELFKLLEIKHSTTTPVHPQCNVQAEVFNKTWPNILLHLWIIQL
jgi:transposase InsO family protein